MVHPTHHTGSTVQSLEGGVLRLPQGCVGRTLHGLTQITATPFPPVLTK